LRQSLEKVSFQTNEDHWWCEGKNKGGGGIITY
jgi:hypothetical protein